MQQTSIYHLPDEIIAQILLDVSYSSDPSGRYYLPATLVQVSRRFHRVTTTTPRLWSHLFLSYRTQVHLCSRRMDRISSAPLCIRFQNTKKQNPTPAILGSLRNLITSWAFRIHTLEIEQIPANKGASLGQFNVAFPALKVLRTRCWLMLQDSTDDLNPCQVTIQELQIEAMHIKTSNWILPNLTHLTLIKVEWSANSLLKLLKRSELLQSLHIECCILPPAAENLEVAQRPTLHHLENVTIICVQLQFISILFESLHLPRLSALQLIPISPHLCPSWSSLMTMRPLTRRDAPPAGQLTLEATDKEGFLESVTSCLTSSFNHLFLAAYPDITTSSFDHRFTTNCIYTPASKYLGNSAFNRICQDITQITVENLSPEGIPQLLRTKFVNVKTLVLDYRYCKATSNEEEEVRRRVEQGTVWELKQMDVQLSIELPTLCERSQEDRCLQWVEAQARAVSQI